MNKKVLVISPHQDDDIIGCGGTIAKFIEKGCEVGVVYVMAGYSGTPSLSTKQGTLLREKEAINACKIIGIKKTFFLKEKDRKLTYNFDTLLKLIKIIRLWKPNIVFLPDVNDGDFEHQIVNKLSQEALWLANSPYLPEAGKYIGWNYYMILFYEVWSPLANPNMFIDITKYIGLKTKALEQHASQINLVDYVGAVKGLNKYRGVMSFAGEYAEAFNIKLLKGDDSII